MEQKSREEWTFSSPLGAIRAGFSGGALACLDFAEAGAKPARKPSPAAEKLRRELNEYFAGKRRAFDLPLAAEGTPFQKRVWDELCRIPFGETRSYGEIAAAVGSAGAARAVGTACRCNPICILVPCHRVVGAGGALTGYAGGLDRKRALLELEMFGPAKHS